MTTLRKELKAGTVLFREGDAPNCAYLIESGIISVQASQNGETIELGKLDSGDILGEMAVIDDAPRTATAIAETDCVLFEINKDQFVERLVKTDPVVRYLLVGLLKRYRKTLASLKGEQIEERFADTDIFERITIDKIRLEGQLKNALDNDALDVRYQPVLDIAADKITGYEALVRWNHPERGLISPDEFVSLAEETALILEVGEYVIGKACEAIKALIANDPESIPFVSVNVSAIQLSHPGLFEHIVECVKRTGIPEESLKIEITEGLALEHKEVQRTIELCHQHGMKVALDDFGTGYSNMTLLHKMNFDTIKVDQAFSRGMVEDSRSIILVKSIVDMCHSLEADVLVEGIESDVMLDILKNLGCKYGQGYHIGIPQTLDELLSN